MTEISKKDKNHCFKIIRKYLLKTMEFEFTIMFIFIFVSSNFVVGFLSDILELYWNSNTITVTFERPAYLQSEQNKYKGNIGIIYRIFFKH